MSVVNPDNPKPRKPLGLEHQRIDKREATSSFAWSILFNFVNKFVLPLVTTAVIARTLGPTIMGSFAVLYAIFMASEVFRDFGLSQTYMRDPKIEGKKEGSYMALGILQGIVPAALLYVVKEPFARFYENPALSQYMGWVSLGLIINGFGTIPRAKVLRNGRVKESGFREMVANILAVAVSVAMVLMGYGFEALVTQLVLNCFLNVAISYGLAPVTDFRFDGRTLFRTARSTGSTLGSNILYNAYALSDKFVIGKIAGQTALGLYAMGQNVAQKPMQLLSVPMMRPLQVAFSQNSTDHQKLGSIYARSLAAAVMFIVPMYALLVLAAEPVSEILLGPKWVGVVPLVQICCIYFGSRTIGTIGGTALVAGGKARFAMMSWIVCYATALAGVLLASGSKNILALAWAFSLGAVGVYTMHTLFAFRWFQPDAAALKKLKQATLAAALTCLLFLGIYFLPFGPWIAFVVGLILGPIFHLAVLGWILERKPGALLSPGGVKRLYRSM